MIGRAGQIRIGFLCAALALMWAFVLSQYFVSVQRSKEIVLRQDLYTLRTAIDQYTYDRMRAPQSLGELVSSGYLHSIPTDPITKTAGWEPVQEDVLLSIDQNYPGIADVHSASRKKALDGTEYSEW